MRFSHILRRFQLFIGFGETKKSAGAANGWSIRIPLAKRLDGRDNFRVIRRRPSKEGGIGWPPILADDTPRKDYHRFSHGRGRASPCTMGVIELCIAYGAKQRLAGPGVDLGSACDVLGVMQWSTKNKTCERQPIPTHRERHVAPIPISRGRCAITDLPRSNERKDV